MFRAVSVPVVLGVVLGIAAILIAIALVMFRAQGTEIPLVSASGEALDSDTADATGGTSSEEPVTSETGSQVTVHVVGAVHAPGVVHLPAGSRVDAVITAAGGATPAAVLAGVNLARVVTDGEQIVVPDASTPVASAVAPAPGAPAGTSALPIVNLNTADAAALESLPGVGPALAARIIDWRSTNGPFTSIEELLQVSGIGAKTLDGFRDRVGL